MMRASRHQSTHRTPETRALKDSFMKKDAGELLLQAGCVVGSKEEQQLQRTARWGRKSDRLELPLINVLQHVGLAGDLRA